MSGKPAASGWTSALTRLPTPALDFLFARTTGGFKFGLERTRALLAELGDPASRGARAAHRRHEREGQHGRDGGGAARARRGYASGRYTSPHLVDFRERIVVDGERRSRRPRSSSSSSAGLPRCERLGATFFEATTALAFQHFARERARRRADRDGARRPARLDERRGAARGGSHVDRVRPRGVPRPDARSDRAREGGDLQAGRARGDRRAVRRGTQAGSRSAREQAGANAVRIVARRDADRATWPSVRQARRSRSTRSAQRATVRTPLLGRHQAANFAFTLALLDAAGPPFATSLADATRRSARPSAARALPARRATGSSTSRTTPTARARSRRRCRRRCRRRAVTVLALCAGRQGLARDARGAGAGRGRASSSPTRPPRRPSRRWPTRGGGGVRVASLGVDVARGAGLRRGARSTRRRTASTTLVTGSFHTVGDAMARLQVSPLAG